MTVKKMIYTAPKFYSHKDILMKSYIESRLFDCNMCVEKHIRLCVRPKPKWLPDFMYRWLLNRFLFLATMRGDE